MFESQPLMIRKILYRLLVWKRARYQWQHGDREHALIRYLAEPHEISVDVGAHKGTYTFSLARYSLEVHAIEANPVLAKALRETFGRKVVVHAFGLSHTSGSMTLWIPHQGGRELIGRSSMVRHGIAEFAARPVEVPVRTLDSLGLEQVGFIKMHIEGHEFAALEGGLATIKRSKPTILVGAQVRFSADDPYRINDLLTGLGYQGYFLKDGRLKPFASFDESVHQRPETVLKVGQSAYHPAFIYNFIYLHPSRPAIRERLTGYFSD